MQNMQKNWKNIHNSQKKLKINGKWTQLQKFQLPYQQMGSYLKHFAKP
jgi:hypothetical protein